MRTTFKLEDGVPKQQVKDDFEYSLELIDLSEESNKEVIFEKWVETHSQKILDLSDCAFESAPD